MTDRTLEQLGRADGPIDPGGRFRERLWEIVEGELTGEDSALSTAESKATADPPAARPGRPRRLRSTSRLGRTGTARSRTVAVAAGLVAVLALGAGAILVDEGPGSRQSIDVAEGPAEPSDVALSESSRPAAGVPGPPTAGPPVPVPERSSPLVRGGAPAAAPRPDPSPSPPRQLEVLYSSFVASDYDVYAVTAGTEEEPTPLVTGRFQDHTAVRSPDGRLYWTRFESGIARYQLWTADADGREPTRLRPPGCEAGDDCVLSWPAAAPDGRLAFSRGRGSTGCSATAECDELVVYDSRRGTAIAVGYGIGADWSPRRDEILYSGHESSTGRNTACAPEGTACPGGDIRIVDLSGPAPVSRVIGGETAGHTPRFSPDGEWVAFERSFASSSARRESVVMRRDGTQKRVLTACKLHPAWAPDGRLACVVSTASGDDVFVLDADDQPDQQLTFTQETEYFFRLYER